MSLEADWDVIEFLRSEYEAFAKEEYGMADGTLDKEQVTDFFQVLYLDFVE